MRSPLFPHFSLLLQITILLLLLLHSLPHTHAQIGTITQDLYTLPAFSLQKPCAQSCFVNRGFCPNDILGSEIGCNSWTDCNERGWQATNDCYCRTDLQNPAQDHLTSCIQRSCTVGDGKIDAATAGSIYAQYCAEKGYGTPAAPATVQATTTTAGLGASTRLTLGVSGPTASSTSAAEQASASGASTLSTTTIIGIVVGGLAGLAALVIFGRVLLKWCGCGRGRRDPYPQPSPPIHQQPVYPMNPYPPPYHYQKATSEVTPDDSVSMVSAMPRPAPTFVSHAQGYSPYR